MSVDTDVLVIGGGGGGLVAAIAARTGGADVVLTEKSPRLGGNTALSSGSVPGAGSRFQHAAGIEDSPELFAADIRRRTDGTAPEHLVRILTEESASLVEWLVDDVGAPLELEPKLKKVGHSVPRTHRPAGRQGAVLLAVLEQVAEARGVTIARGNAAVALIGDGAGGVAGARLRSGDNAPEDAVHARKVILACNGFGGNPEMVRRYCPEAADAPYFGHQGNTGEGIRWGMELGAEVRHMAAYQGHGSVAYPHGSLLSWSIQEMGGFLVNNRAERFVDETFGYSGCAASVLRQPDNAAYAIFDARIHAYMAPLPDFAGLVEVGGVKTGDIRAVAEGLKLDPARLEATLAAYNAMAAGAPDPLGRTSFAGAPLQGPFSGVRVTAGLFHTQGGLMVDADARVLRADGSAVGSLYAAGGTAVGISGSDGGKGYCSANGLLTALGLGRLAGRHASKTL